MKPFLVRITAVGGRRLRVSTLAPTSVDALLRVLGAVEALGLVARCGSACLARRVA